MCRTGSEGIPWHEPEAMLVMLGKKVLVSKRYEACEDGLSSCVGLSSYGNHYATETELVDAHLHDRGEHEANKEMSESGDLMCTYSGNLTHQRTARQGLYLT